MSSEATKAKPPVAPRSDRLIAHDVRPDTSASDIERSSMDPTGELLKNLAERLERIETSLGLVCQAVVEKPPTKEWYTPDEAAKLLGKSKLTVREHCRFGRIHAKKRQAGRGSTSEWAIAHAEVLRIQNEGLLPLRKHVPDRL